MTENKQQKNTKQALIIALIGGVVFLAWRFPVYFFVALGLIVGILVFAYIKVPNFHYFIHEKLHLKKKPNGLPTAQIRQGNSIATARQDLNYMCQQPGCAGLMETVQNFDGKYGLCNTCGKVQRIINKGAHDGQNNDRLQGIHANIFGL